MKRQTLVNGLLSLTAVTMMTGCVDDKYDLSDIDTTSRFTVDNLTVPVNLSEIKLKNVVNLDDNDLIEKVVIDGRECYSIVKTGNIDPKEFSIDKVNVTVPKINPSSINIGLGGLPVPPGTYIPVEFEHSLDVPASDMVDYSFNMNNVPEALIWLKNIKTTPIKVKVTLSIPKTLLGTNNEFSFQALKLKLPQDLMGVSGVTSYNPETGDVTISNVAVGSDGTASIEVVANGLDLGEKGKVIDNKLGINGNVGVLGGRINLKIKDITLPDNLNIGVDYEVSPFTIESFSGQIDYKMDDIKINPISLSDLPDFLNNPETNIIIANPQIKVNIVNPVAKYGLVGKGRLTLSSQFKEGNPVIRSSDVFNLADHDGDGICGLTFAPKVNEGDPDMCAFTGLGYVLTMLDENPAAISGGWGLPESISVAIEDLSFAGNVTDFPLGNIGSASGDYSFNAPLGFESGSTVFYETTEDGWGSEDLDKVNIKTINLTAVCTTDLPVSIQLRVVPVDRHGNDIAVIEDNLNFEVPANATKHPVSLKIQAKDGTTIKDFDGMRFRAIIGQHSPWYPEGDGTTEAIGPDLLIKLDDVRVTVDGYYETDF